MLNTVKKEDLNQISLTGLRAIVLLNLLIIAPRSIEEIRTIMVEHKILDETSSNDILRIDINTLKAAGCEISRASKKTDYKYVLTEHPFSLNINDEQFKTVQKVYKKIEKDLSVEMLLEYYTLFKKISDFVYGCETKERLMGLSALKHFNVEFVENLLKDCKLKNILTIIYNNPTNRNIIPHEILAQQLVFKNNKLYLYGYNLKKQKPIVLNIKRILKILSRRKNNDETTTESTEVIFYLKKNCIHNLDENEEVIEKLEDNYLVKGKYHNEFLAIQRILSFGAGCKIVEPVELKNEIIKKLVEMRKVYEP